MNVLYAIFILPFELLIGLLLSFFYDLSGHYGISLICLSFAITALMLPLYYFAEKLQQKERAIQATMRPKIDEYKSVYKGYELHLYVSNIYKQHNYHPLLAFRSLLGLAIQLPFFIAAYSYLSAYAPLEGESFAVIQDLSQPDALLHAFGMDINLLPFLMTAVNLLSGFIYGRSLARAEQINILVIAAVFLILLYTAPSGLLVYWTGTNFFCLFKNLAFRKIFDKDSPDVEGNSERKGGE